MCRNAGFTRSKYLAQLIKRTCDRKLESQGIEETPQPIQTITQTQQVTNQQNVLFDPVSVFVSLFNLDFRVKLPLMFINYFAFSS